MKKNHMIKSTALTGAAAVHHALADSKTLDPRHHEQRIRPKPTGTAAEHRAKREGVPAAEADGRNQGVPRAERPAGTLLLSSMPTLICSPSSSLIYLGLGRIHPEPAGNIEGMLWSSSFLLTPWFEHFVS